MVALYYKSESFSSAMSKLMGRNVAGSTFLDGLLEFGALERLSLFVDDGTSQKAAHELQVNLKNQVHIEVITAQSFSNLERAGNIFMPGPDIGALCSKRSFMGHSKWSTTGITHTTSSALVMDGIGDLLISPVQDWDAVICTSPSVKSHVTNILEAKKNYLVHRLGIQKLPNFRLPVIPLGIDTSRFEPLPKVSKLARQQLNIDAGTLVVTFVGRLSWHAKAHPLPLYIALKEVARKIEKKIVLIECGWHANETARQVFDDTHAEFKDDLCFYYVDGRDPAAVNDVYAVSDIFVSLSDNIQETFGITPIEAMSAGVPVVVSDWDGYRHSVRDGVDGFCIKTLRLENTHAQDLIYRYEMDLDTYDFYCGHTSMLNAIDVGQLINRLTQLCENEGLRKKLGAAGAKRARETYDWSVIIPQYTELWSELDAIRTANKDPNLSSPTIWPERLDPMIGFKSYPSHVLEQSQTLERGSVYGERLEVLFNNFMITYAKQVTTPLYLTKAALASLGDAFSVAELSEALSPSNPTLGTRFVANLIKFDVVRLC
jgi:alpha-maltose-1-phosphate synthase